MAAPKEVLAGAKLKGPLFASVQSGTSQWAGRTTLNSGSATVTVSTFAVQSDSLIIIGNEGSGNFDLVAGTMTVASATVLTTLSNAAVAADSLVFLQPKHDVAQNSGNAVPFSVVSLAAGWFSAGPSNQVSADIAHLETTLMYQVLPADGIPAPIEVRSINDSSYFILGRSDGVAAARDEVVLWQITQTAHR